MPEHKRYVVRLDGEEVSASVRAGTEAERLEVEVEGKSYEVTLAPGGRRIVRSEGSNDQLLVSFSPPQGPSQLSVAGEAIDYEILDAAAAARERAMREASGGAGNGRLESPMPGRVVKVLVESGQAVKRGESLIIVEAMKMENELHAQIDGVVESIYVEAGATVDAGQALIDVQAHAEDS